MKLSEVMAKATVAKGANVSTLANKVKLACDPAGREWRKRDRRLRKPYNLSAPCKA